MEKQLKKSLTCPVCYIPDKSYLKFKTKNFRVFFCTSCLNGFTNPVPEDMDKYYPDNYWRVPGILGNLKSRINDYFQSRRIKWVKAFLKKGRVLDVGAGEALFAKKLEGFDVLSIDTPRSKIKNTDVLKVDFPNWNTKKSWDAVSFWESLEHVNDPKKYLKKAFKILKNGGFILIESPCFNCFESRLFGKNWYHLDPPRHLVHLSKTGLEKILKEEGFKIVLRSAVFAPEYMYPGFLVSFLNWAGPDALESYLKKSNTFWLLTASAIFLPFAVLLESILYLSGNSPIMLLIARKIK